MLNCLKIIFSITGISLATYGLITRDFQLNYLMILFLGFFMFTLGIQEFQKHSLWLVPNGGIYIFNLCVRSELCLDLKEATTVNFRNTIHQSSPSSHFHQSLSTYIIALYLYGIQLKFAWRFFILSISSACSIVRLFISRFATCPITITF